MRSALLIAIGLVFFAGSFFDFGASSERSTVIAKTQAGRVDTLVDVVPIDVKVCRDFPQNSPEVLSGNCYSTRSVMDQNGGIDHPWATIVGGILIAAGIASLFIRKRAPASPTYTWECSRCDHVNPGSARVCDNCTIGTNPHPR